MNKLPDKPSELFETALNDLRLCEQDPAYSIDMSIWHHPMDGQCVVCMAGATLAKSLDVGHDKFVFVNPVDPDLKYKPSDDTDKKMTSINAFRMGDLSSALLYLKVSVHDHNLPEFFPTPEYASDREGFHKSMRGMIELLKARGL